MPTYDVLNAVTVTAAVFNGANQFVTTIGTWTLNENQKVYFSVDLEQYAPNGGQVVMFSGSTVGTFTDNIKVHGLDSLSQYYDQLGAGQWEFAFGTAGDILTGGAGTDTFQYASGDGVDVIQDFHRTDGDVLKLVSISADDVEIINDSADSYVVFKDALAASGHLDDAAIKIVGVNDFSISDITFAV
jgi:hypothetical protein